MTPKLALHDVIVRRGGQVTLDVPALEIVSGEVLAVVGPNGAGKSTLVQVLGLLERPAAGAVLLDGRPVTGHELAARRRMATVFQEPLLLDRSVRDNVILGMRLRGVRRSERGQRAGRWLEALGIGGLARRRPHQLSGGEAQRASLARALALDPEVLLLDEPFSALDAPTRARLAADLGHLLHQQGQTTVLVTHDRDEALQLATRVAVLIGGRLRQAGSVEAVFARPADPEVAAFLGVETIVPGVVVARGESVAQVRAGGVLIEAAGAALPLGDAVFLCIRPEDVVLAPATAEPVATSARNRLPAVVGAVTPTGGQRRVELDCGFPLVAVVTRRSAEELAIVPGAALVASFKASAVHLVPQPEPAAPPKGSR